VAYHNWGEEVGHQRPEVDWVAHKLTSTFRRTENSRPL